MPARWHHPPEAGIVAFIAALCGAFGTRHLRCDVEGGFASDAVGDEIEIAIGQGSLPHIRPVPRLIVWEGATGPDYQDGEDGPADDGAHRLSLLLWVWWGVCADRCSAGVCNE